MPFAATMLPKSQTTTGTLLFDPRLPPIHTDYTSAHLGNAGFCAADLVLQSGAVIANSKGDVLLLEDLRTGRIELPRSQIHSSLESVFDEPLRFVEEKAGILVERLPLLKQRRRYRNPFVKEYTLLEQELLFENYTTTGPFAMGIDVVYVERSELPDGRQSFTSWFAGLVRDQPQPGMVERNGARLHFMPVEKARQTVQDPYCDHLAARVLVLFEALWEATQASMVAQK